LKGKGARKVHPFDKKSGPDTHFTGSKRKSIRENWTSHQKGGALTPKKRKSIHDLYIRKMNTLSCWDQR